MINRFFSDAAGKKPAVLEGLAVLTFYTAVYCLFFSPVLVAGNIFPSDGILPDFYAEFGLWSNHIFSGYPVFAAPERQTFYPIRLVFTLLPTNVAYNFFVISAYVLASSFTYSYIHTITNSRYASVCGGLIFGLSGFMTAHLIHTSMIHAAAWLPLVVLAFEKLRTGFSPRWFTIACIALAMSTLAGHPQITVYTIIVSWGYVLFTTYSLTRGKFIYIGQCFAATLLAMGLAAVQILPTLELTAVSIRSSMSYEDFQSFSLPINQVFQLLMPFIYGGVYESPYNTSYYGAYNLHELTGYIGIGTIFFLAIGVMHNLRNIVVIYWVIAAILAVLITLGDSTPLFRLLYEFPVINLFRGHTRFFLISSFAIAVLASLGIKNVLKSQLNKRFTTVFPVTIILTLVFILTYINYHSFELAAIQRKIELPPFFSNTAILVPLVIAAMSPMVVLLVNKLRARIFAPLLLLTFIVLDMGSFAWFLDWKYKDQNRDILTAPDHVSRYKTTLESSHHRFAPLSGYWSNVLNPTQSRLFQLESTSGYGPLLLKSFSDISGINTNGAVDGSVFPVTNLFLDLFAVKYISFDRRNDHLYGNITEYGDRFKYIEDINGSPIYENVTAMPRYWLVPKVVSVTEWQALEAIHTAKLPTGEKLDLKKVALVEAPFNFNSGTLNQNATVKALEIENEYIKMQSKSDQQAFLVLSDINYPGWVVFLDGVRSKIYKTNHSLRGVVIPEGTHSIVFKFRPPSLLIGATISIIALILILALSYLYRAFYRKSPLPEVVNHC